MANFRLGINYWPRRSAMYMWERFDIGEIREDFAYLAALGMDTVRFFLLWEAFQPEPTRMDHDALDRLIALMDALHEHGLQAMPTLFCGHMSGVNWLPPWTLDHRTEPQRFRTIGGGKEIDAGIGDFYTGHLLDAQVFHVREVGKALRGHPALWAWDLGNEFSNLREPRTIDETANWSATLTHALQEASGAPVTGGTHGEDITRDRHIRPSSICAPWIFATMHGYSVYSTFARNRFDTNVVPFLSEIMSACSNKPVLFSEFGNPTCPPGTICLGDVVDIPDDAHAPSDNNDVKAGYAPFACLQEEEMIEYAFGVLNRLHDRGALGAFWWCYADYAKELSSLPPFDKAPHELTFGIIRNDGSEKPIAGALRAFASEHRQTREPRFGMVNEEYYYSVLPNVDQFYCQYLENHP